MNNSYDKTIISGSILKLLRHRAFINQEKKPISAQVILTNRCNLKCVFCCNKKRWGPQEMEKKAAFKVLEDLRDLGCKGVEFTGGSEPTVHRHFNDVLAYCIKLGMKPALVTNGIRLTTIPLDLIEKLDWIRISINASRKNYKNIHGVDAYDKVIKGLEYIDNISIPNKGISYIFCFQTTLRDAQDLIDDLQRFNLDYFRFSIDVFNEPKCEIKAPNFKSDRFPVVSHANRPTYIPKVCNIFYYKPVIDCSGNVYPCCTNMHNEILPLGSVTNLKQIYNRKDKKLDTKECIYCIYGEANDLIYQMEQDMKNEDFI